MDERPPLPFPLNTQVWVRKTAETAIDEPCPTCRKIALLTEELRSVENRLRVATRTTEAA